MSDIRLHTLRNSRTQTASRATTPLDNTRPPPPPAPTLHPARTRAHPCPSSPRHLHPLLPFRLRGGTKDGGGTSMVMENPRKRERCSGRASAILVACMMVVRRRRKGVGRPVLRGCMTQRRRCVRKWLARFPSYDLTDFSDRRCGEDQRTGLGLCPYDHQVRR
jgi:hypothetical protein